MRNIDGHVHLVGDGSSGSGCWIRLDSLFRRLQARVMLRGAEIPFSSMGSNLDEAYAEALRKMVAGAPSLNAVVLLAQDLPHDDEGRPMPEKGGFFVPNDYLFQVVESAPDLFIPAVSIHPARPDALAELEQCIERGARVLKLLPNCLNVDCSAPRFQKFWERMAEAEMILLAHTGGEKTLPVLRPEFANPRNLTLPLECGVTVIAAHLAGRSGIFDSDYTDEWLAMLEKFPRLYGDNSALSSLNRSRTAKRVLHEAMAMDRIIHGSDFPVPIIGLGPRMLGLISGQDYQKSRRERNSLERDYGLKKAMGFSERSFTQLDSILTGRT